MIARRNNNDSKVLFSTIHNLIEPSSLLNIIFTDEKCQEFAEQLRLKINKIRSDICQHHPACFNSYDHVIFKDALEDFALVVVVLLKKVTLQLKSSTCSLDPIPVTF